jgi:hypothetical protein
MPFLLHRPDITEPSEIGEHDAQRILKTDFPDPEMYNNVWSKLLKGERVFVRPGQLEWTSDATTG